MTATAPCYGYMHVPPHKPPYSARLELSD